MQFRDIRSFLDIIDFNSYKNAALAAIDKLISF
jgi:hypothetical protein